MTMALLSSATPSPRSCTGFKVSGSDPLGMLSSAPWRSTVVRSSPVRRRGGEGYVLLEQVDRADLQEGTEHSQSKASVLPTCCLSLEDTTLCLRPQRWMAPSSEKAIAVSRLQATLAILSPFSQLSGSGTRCRGTAARFSSANNFSGKSGCTGEVPASSTSRTKR
jgi:hypothetical protein